MTAIKRRLWKRIFKRSDYVSEVVEKALEAQAAFEEEHPIPFAVDQRYAALVQRATGLCRGRPPAAVLDMLREAAADWRRASEAAKEVP